MSRQDSRRDREELQQVRRQTEEDGRQDRPRRSALQRTAALAAVVLLTGLYIVTFVLAIAGKPGASALLRFCFGLTIFLPIFLWVVLWCAGRLFHKKNIASLDILNSSPEERRRMEEALALRKDSEKAGRDE